MVRVSLYKFLGVVMVRFVAALSFAVLSLIASDGYSQNQQLAFCSGYNHAGNWAIYYGQLDYRVSCLKVRQNLMHRGGSGVLVQWQAGLYNTTGFNSITVSCGKGLYRQTFTGAGAMPIHAAYNYAVLSRLPFCLFYAN